MDSEGIIKYLKQKTKERKRLNQSFTSYMTVSDSKDFRAFLTQVTSFSVSSVISTLSAVDSAVLHNMNNRGTMTAREQAD
jgi:hypothetical protein